MIFVSRTIFCFLFVLCMTFYPQTYKQGSWVGGGVVGVCPTPSLISALSMLHCLACDHV